MEIKQRLIKIRILELIVLSAATFIILLRITNIFYFKSARVIPDFWVAFSALVIVAIFWMEQMYSKKEIERLYKELKSIEALKSDIISTVSHELRTPLASLKEFTSILSDGIPGPVNDEQKKYLSIMASNADRLTRMINDLLDMSKIQIRKLKLKRKPVNIKALIEREVTLLKPQAEKRGLNLEIEIPGELPVIFVDPDKISQVLINLVGNAIKFTPFFGKIVVTVLNFDDNVEVSVRDTGRGIAKDKLEKLFDKFSEPGEAAVLREDKSLGLGLSLSKEIIELHMGRIWAVSELGKGSKFVFSLPKLNEDACFVAFADDLVAQASLGQFNVSIIVFDVADRPSLEANFSKEKFDELILKMKNLISTCVRRELDIVSRFKEGKFIVILCTNNKIQAEGFAKRIQSMVSKEQFSVGGDIFKINIIYQIATYPEDGNSAKELMDRLGIAV